jgi:hypothetical protein
LDPGTISTTLALLTNADEGELSIPVTMDVLADAILVPGDTAAVFGFLQDSIILSLRNDGNISSDFAIAFSDDFVSCSPSSGNLARDSSIDITMIVDRTGLPSDTLPARFSMYLSDGGGKTDTLTVYVYNYTPDRWSIPFRIVDAEYSRDLGKIAVVSTDPSQFHLLDPETNSIQSIDLVLPPNCVAIRFDGAFAIVGHNALVTYIDLSSMQVLHTWAVATDAIDIILPSNGWAYVFPRTDQWTRIHCIELATGLDLTHIGYSARAGTLARLHPSEEYIYGADNGLSPSDFEKYDIRTDTLILMYDSPYHGDYAFSGNVWISDDGMNLFARSSNVFTSSETRSLDMIYDGNLAGISRVTWAEHSSAAGRVYVLGSSGYYGTVQLYAYEADYFAYMGMINLPKFVVPSAEGGELLPTMGKFVFANAAGTELYVLATGQQDSGFENTWAVIKLLTADQP